MALASHLIIKQPKILGVKNIIIYFFPRGHRNESCNPIGSNGGKSAGEIVMLS